MLKTYTPLATLKLNILEVSAGFITIVLYVKAYIV